MFDLLVIIGLGVAIWYGWKYLNAYKVYVIGVVVIIAAHELIGIKWMLIVAALWFAYTVYSNNQYQGQFKRWSKQMSSTHNYTSMIVRANLEVMAKAFRLSQDDLPYGRSTGFLQSFGDQELTEADVDFYGYSPVRSQIADEFVEYGSLLSTYGILHKNQVKQGAKKDVYTTEFIKLPFKGLWGVSFDADSDKFTFNYPDEAKEVKLNVSQPDQLVRVLTNLISLGYTNDLYTGWIKNQSDAEMQQNLAMARAMTSSTATSNSVPEKVESNDEHPSRDQLDAKLTANFDQNQRLKNFDKSQRAGVIGGSAANVGTHMQDIQLNQMVSGRQGHGVAAEYGNNLADKIKHPFSDVRQTGQDNALSGADRVVGSQQIQTKYYQTASGSVNAGFGDDGMYKYVDSDGQPMQLEVPKDQYAEALTKMKQKISDGKVPGVSDPEDAKNLLRKGDVTYRDSFAIAQGGNLESIKYDVRDGAIQSLAGASISFVIVFANAKWSGKDATEAAKLAGVAGFKSLAVGTVIYAGSQQFAKIATRRLTEEMGKKAVAEKLAQRAGYVASLALTIGPDAVETLRGRISLKQLTKDALVAGGGMAGGMAGGAAGGAAVGSALGSVVPFVGTMIGGIAGGYVAKKVLDHFMEDDAVEMFAELKEEFLDTIYSVSIDNEEFQKVQQMVFDDKVGSKLKAMFAADNSRKYARDTIIGDPINTIMGDRPTVNDNEIIEAYETAQNSFDIASA